MKEILLLSFLIFDNEYFNKNTIISYLFILGEMVNWIILPEGV